MFQELVDPWSLKGKIRIIILEPIIAKLKSVTNYLRLCLLRPQKTFPFIIKKLISKMNNTQPQPFLQPVLNYKDGNVGPYSKRALVTYVANPFYLDPYISKAGHSNAFQSIEIAKAFNRLGFVVDIVDFMDTGFIPTQHYDAFFGMHYNFERLLPYLDASTIKIYYGTGAYWAFEISAEEQRIQYLKSRRGVELNLPIRLKENNWVQISDAVVVIGNQFTLDTYKPNRLYSNNLFVVDNSTVPILPNTNLVGKNFNSAKHNFLWFGSNGLLHKGLDLVLEAFSQVKDVHLWVCGPLESDNEKKFIEIYRKELFSTPNIHPIGIVDIHSKKFKKLKNICAFTILASCSEGMAGSILNCMQSGLIPLVSAECGIDTGNFGITFKNNQVEELIKVINETNKMDSEKCQEWAENSLNEAKNRYTINNFKLKIESVLKEILS